MEQTQYPKVTIPGGITERVRDEITMKGWAPVHVELEDGTYELTFINPLRLGQELGYSADSGEPFIADPGLVVVPEVTVEAIYDVVPRLHKKRFFETLRPIKS